MTGSPIARISALTTLKGVRSPRAYSFGVSPSRSFSRTKEPPAVCACAISCIVRLLALAGLASRRRLARAAPGVETHEEGRRQHEHERHDRERARGELRGRC